MIKELFDIQREVDNKIIEKLKEEHNRIKNNSKSGLYKLICGNEYDFKTTLNDRKIAFRIELSELANEIGFFKYWKTSHEINDFRIKDEWADCLAFLLSIIITTNNESFVENKLQIDLFTVGGYIPREYSELDSNKMDSKIDYLNAFRSLLWLGIACGYSRDELFEAYKNKSKENIRRAKEGY